MTDPNAARPPEFTRHAVRRFQERIAPLPAEAIADWFAQAWKARKAKHANGRDRAHIRTRNYRGRQRRYLMARAPNGRVVYLALSADGEAVCTVLDTWHWNLFAGEPIPPDQVQRERIIGKLIAPERLALELRIHARRPSGNPNDTDQPAPRAEGTTS